MGAFFLDGVNARVHVADEPDAHQHPHFCQKPWRHTQVPIDASVGLNRLPRKHHGLLGSRVRLAQTKVAHEMVSREDKYLKG
jgi:hypothetical protein